MIYATPFNQSTKQVTGASVDSGLTSLDQAQEMTGGDRIAKRIVVVGNDEERVAFSDFVFDHES